jgi:hypothetical protein
MYDQIDLEFEVEGIGVFKIHSVLREFAYYTFG